MGEEEEEEDMKLNAAEEANPFAMFSLTNSPQLHKAGTSHPHFADVYLVIRLDTISLPELYECTMAKAKGKGKGNKSSNVPQRHLHSRASFLYQAAILLAGTQMSGQTARMPLLHAHQIHQATEHPKAKHVDTTMPLEKSEGVGESQCTQEPGSSVKRGASQGLPMAHAPMARHLIAHLRGVSLKSQIRLSPAIKRSLCKRCDTLLVPGSTSTSRMENLSKGGRKPWADVLIIQCGVCHAEKRFPVGAPRQQKREQRRKGAGKQPEVNDEGGVDERGSATSLGVS